MSDDGINIDFSQLVVAHTPRMNWQASAGGTVWLKPLDLIGGAPEFGRMTSLVRYDPGSSFPERTQPDGEEILVIDGVLSDQHGDYSAGSFLLNPQGFKFSCSSRDGCVLFVKLRQYPGSGRQRVVVDTGRSVWQSADDDAIRVIPLYREDGYPEEIRLVRLQPKTVVASHEHEGGAEIFVLTGSFSDEHGSYEEGSWVRYPDGIIHRVSSRTGCTYYLKTGHLPGSRDPAPDPVKSA